MTTEQIQALDDRELLVQETIAAVNAFGYGSYRHEYKAQSEKNHAIFDAIRAEVLRRGLADHNGTLTPAGVACDHESDRRVLAKEADNRAYFSARFGTGHAHRSPYGERYGS